MFYCMLYAHLLDLAAYCSCINYCSIVRLNRFVSISSKAEVNLLLRQMNKYSISNATV